MSMSPGQRLAAWLAVVGVRSGGPGRQATLGGAVSTSRLRAAAFMVALMARSAWYTRPSSSALAWMCTSFCAALGA
jgi:hypothetical protein